MAIARLTTIADLEQMPDDGHRYELMRGVLKQMPPTAAPHLIVAGRLISYLNSYLKDHDLGDAGGEDGSRVDKDPPHSERPGVRAMLPAHGKWFR